MLKSCSLLEKDQPKDHEHSPSRAKQLADSARSDEQLVRDCLKGKDSAWSALIFKYKNLIFSIPIRYGFSEEDAADIFQAVCMGLLAELSRLREPKALAGWLIQVTRNKCFHRKRETQRHSMQESRGRRISWIRRISGQPGFRVSAGPTFARSTVGASPQ
jgi:DNA-directed RNA polymerase specialized sigma24 family protein